MNFFVIGDEDTVLGFKLAGLEGRIVNSPEEAKEALDTAVANRDIGIIIITEKVAESIREEVDKFIFGTTFPLIVEIPDRSGPLPKKLSLKELARKAIGVGI